jgi:hypothetical protein
MSKSTVTVGCKIPNGIKLQLRHPSHDNGRGEMVAGPVKAEFTLKGPSRPLNIMPDSFAAELASGGFGLTEIPEDFWLEWVSGNLTLDMVAKGFIFAEDDHASAVDHAKDNKDVRTGMEPADPNKPGPGLERATA